MKITKTRILISVILIAGLVITVMLYVNPPVAVSGDAGGEVTEYASEAWIAAALITISAVLVVFSLDVLRKSRIDGKKRNSGKVR